MRPSLNRRKLLAHGGTVGVFVVSGQCQWLTARAAEPRQFEPQILTGEQCEALAIVADQLVPGSRASGIAAYIDLQLQRGDESLLIGKYLGVDTSDQRDFYSAAADNLLAAMAEGAAPKQIVDQMAVDSLSVWSGAPASYVQFVLRADALDVTYGTPEGFEKLGIPYMPQKMPDNPW